GPSDGGLIEPPPDEPGTEPVASATIPIRDLAAEADVRAIGVWCQGLGGLAMLGTFGLDLLLWMRARDALRLQYGRGYDSPSLPDIAFLVFTPLLLGLVLLRSGAELKRLQGWARWTAIVCLALLGRALLFVLEPLLLAGYDAIAKELGFFFSMNVILDFVLGLVTVALLLFGLLRPRVARIFHPSYARVCLDLPDSGVSWRASRYARVPFLLLLIALGTAVSSAVMSQLR
ncbi:MAG: hypothetical protein HZA54_02295, partial [Planctomycetes bacterium]|nr:hypothetical protein [Planctomycetota bacterium]